jgi:SAM-dependent methyltransferase
MALIIKARSSPDQSLSNCLSVPESKILRIMEGRITETYMSDDPRWRKIRDEAIGNRGLSWRRLLGRLIRAQGRNGRDQAEIRRTYDQHYGATTTVLDWLNALDERTQPVEWRDKGMIVTPQAVRVVHLLYLSQAIKTLKPRRVLEVGCGNGNMLFSLAVTFPDIEFCGVELNTAGVALAHKAQELENLPDSFARVCAAPMRDNTAHRRVSIQAGDARALPFPNRSFDLVYTRLALEQMEQIRPQALSEITRVADSAVALIEPWRDFNKSDPGKAYIRRMGYFNGKSSDLGLYGFTPILVTDDIPQKVQFKAGPVIALRKQASR